MNTSEAINYTNDKKQVKIVIPVYKLPLKESERTSIERVFSLLGMFDICFIAPEGLVIDDEITHGREVVYFDKSFFDGIHGYNRMMLSSDFYKRFSDYEYILICQTDAYIFKNTLGEWLDKGYDYIGAPWLMKPKYRTPHYRMFLKFKNALNRLRGKECHEDKLGDKIGNGGLSLRRVDACITSLDTRPDTVRLYLERCLTDKEHNEDVYWALENPEFRYPTLHEAIRFSIDERPEYAMRELGGELPFGCHGWNKPFAEEFWAKYIGLSEKDI